MYSCDILIAGGGPAGSSCAWGLRGSGLDVAILDKAGFPRDKICGGWITPAVVDELALDLRDYSAGRVLQPITGFRTSGIGGRAIGTDYGRVVSYGVRRCQFDHYLVARCGTRLFEHCPVSRMERRGDTWIVNGAFRAKLVVGAGGHFCPVARFMGARLGAEPIVAAQEVEFRLNAGREEQCSVRAGVPELFFCHDMKGYGWCFRKSDFINIGLGRMDRQKVADHVRTFVGFLRESGRIPRDSPEALPGHAYLLGGHSLRRRLGDGLMLVGDAAGLAYPQSGEGIRPAIESGLLAARVILEAAGVYSTSRLRVYGALLDTHLGKRAGGLAGLLARVVPGRATNLAAAALLQNRWFSRRVLLDRWFLGLGRPVLVSALTVSG